MKKSLNEQIARIKSIMKEGNESSDNFQKYNEFLNEIFSSEFEVIWSVNENPDEESDSMWDSTFGKSTGKVLKRNLKPLAVALSVRPGWTADLDDAPDFKTKRYMVEFQVVFQGIDLGTDQYHMIGMNTRELQHQISDILKKHGLRMIPRVYVVGPEQPDPQEYVLSLDDTTSNNMYASISDGISRGNRDLIDYAYQDYAAK